MDILIENYLKQSNSLTKDNIDEISHQFVTLFFAGTDTTAHLLSFMSYQLAKD